VNSQPAIVLAFIAAIRLSGQTIEVTTTGVGIGTTSPATKLMVSTSATSMQNLFSLENSDSSGAGAQLSFIHSGTVKGSLSSRWDGSAWEVRLGTASDYGSYLTFFTNNGSLGERMRIASSGNVGIGTTSPNYPLTVSGSVRASQFIADVNTYADFVFKSGYKLASLDEVEAAIKRDGHLPGIPAETEVKEHGIDLASQQAKLLQKVEELTLYVIELKKENLRLQLKIEGIEAESRSDR